MAEILHEMIRTGLSSSRWLMIGYDGWSYHPFFTSTMMSFSISCRIHFWNFNLIWPNGIILHQPRFFWNSRGPISPSKKLPKLRAKKVGSWGRDELWPNMMIFNSYAAMPTNQSPTPPTNQHQPPNENEPMKNEPKRFSWIFTIFPQLAQVSCFDGFSTRCWCIPSNVAVLGDVFSDSQLGGWLDHPYKIALKKQGVTGVISTYLLLIGVCNPMQNEPVFFL